MKRTGILSCRRALVVVLLLLLVLALAPNAFAGEVARVSGDAARVEANELVGRVSSVSMNEPEAVGAMPSWKGTSLGEPLLIHSRYGDPSEYVFPVVGPDGKTVSTIGVGASDGEWHWYSSSSSFDSFPPVSADEALEKAEGFMRKLGISQELPAPQARMETDKRVYWYFDTRSTLSVPDLYLPAFNEGEIITERDIVSIEQEAYRPISDNRAAPLTETSGGEPPRGDLEEIMAVPPQYDIAVPYHGQETDFWCGPSALEMVFDYWGPDVPQTEIAKVVDAQSPGGCYADDLLRAAQFSSSSRAVQDANLKGYTNRKKGYMAAEEWWSEGGLYGNRYSDLKRLISTDYPVLILTWYDAAHGGGHFRVVKGYNDALDVFVVHDPWNDPSSLYYGPNVNFNQNFLVDDLWAYSDRWATVISPWKVNVTKPGKVSKGQKFEVKARVTYPGPSPLSGQFGCGSPYAKINLSDDYELLDVEEFKNLPDVTYTGSGSTVTWNVKAKKNKSSTSDISVSAQAKVKGNSRSYENYQDYIGRGGSFSEYSPTWYLAEGSTAWGFGCMITLENPNSFDVTVDVTFNTDSGPVECAPLTLPAASQAMVNPASVLGDADFSTKVVCQEGYQIAVDRVMWWTGPGAPSGDCHCSVGVTAPFKTWYLAEGSSAWGFECWLLIQNPGNTAATCDVTYMIEGVGPRTFTKKVPANSRRTYNMADDIGSADASIKVESNVPVIPERAMYRNNKREGHDSIGTTAPSSNFYLAEGTTAWGFTTYVLVQNPNPSPTEVTVTYMTPNGPSVQTPFTVPANQRKTIKVNDDLPNTDFSTQVHGSQPIIAERAMYWGEGTAVGEACHGSIGLAKPHATFYLPCGQTSNGYETWTLIQNPNDTDVTVGIAYLTQSGQNNQTFTEVIPANSRRTFNMADRIPDGTAAILVTSFDIGKKVMVERAMYGNNRGAGMDTIGGYNDLSNPI